MRGRLIAGEIGVADGRDWSPEVVGVFGVEYGDVGVASGHRDERKETRAVHDVHVLCLRYLVDDGIIAARAREKPETADLGLLGGAPLAVERAELADFIEIARPGLGIERRRRLGAELRAARHGPRCVSAGHGVARHDGRHIDAGAAVRAIALAYVAAVVR